MIQQLNSIEISKVDELVPEKIDTLAEELAAEYRAFLSELAPVTSTSSQAKPAAVPTASNTATSTAAANNTSNAAVPATSTTSTTSGPEQQQLEKTIAQMKPALGTNIDPKKAAQALSAAVSGQQAGQQASGNAAKDFAPALGQILSKPDLATQFKNLLNKLK